jgi:hypothetical protein
MMASLASYILCVFLLWPALVRRFAPQPITPTYRRSWGAVVALGPRVVAVRLQVAIGGAL